MFDGLQIEGQRLDDTIPTSGSCIVTGRGVDVCAGVLLVIGIATGIVVITWRSMTVQVAKKPVPVSQLSVSSTTFIYPVLEVNAVRTYPTPVSGYVSNCSFEQDCVSQRKSVTKSYPFSRSNDEKTRLTMPFEAIIHSQCILFLYCEDVSEIVPELVAFDGLHTSGHTQVTDATALLVGFGVVLTCVDVVSAYAIGTGVLPVLTAVVGGVGGGVLSVLTDDVVCTGVLLVVVDVVSTGRSIHCSPSVLVFPG